MNLGPKIPLRLDRKGTWSTGNVNSQLASLIAAQGFQFRLPMLISFFIVFLEGTVTNPAI